MDMSGKPLLVNLKRFFGDLMNISSDELNAQNIYCKSIAFGLLIVARSVLEQFLSNLTDKELSRIS